MNIPTSNSNGFFPRILSYLFFRLARSFIFVRSSFLLQMSCTCVFIFFFLLVEDKPLFLVMNVSYALVTFCPHPIRYVPTAVIVCAKFVERCRNIEESACQQCERKQINVFRLFSVHPNKFETSAARKHILRTQICCLHAVRCANEQSHPILQHLANPCI